jgi:hypothetical protein
MQLEKNALSHLVKTLEVLDGGFADLPDEPDNKNMDAILSDQDQVHLLRSCLMKPKHEQWLDRIWAVMDRVADSPTTNTFQGP